MENDDLSNGTKFLVIADEIAREVMDDNKRGGSKDFNEILYSKIGILYINPKSILKDPVIDSVTKKLAWLWHRNEDSGLAYFGFHRCSCGATSASAEFLIVPPSGEIFVTNSLCVHYAAYHRDEIPEEEMEKLMKIIESVTEEDLPTDPDLHAPGQVVVT